MLTVRFLTKIKQQEELSTLMGNVGLTQAGQDDAHSDAKPELGWGDKSRTRMDDLRLIKKHCFTNFWRWKGCVSANTLRTRHLHAMRTYARRLFVVPAELQATHWHQ